jgi:hypothetical protein
VVKKRGEEMNMVDFENEKIIFKLNIKKISIKEEK